MNVFEVAAFLAQNAIKATIVFAAAGLVVKCCPRRPAAVHHAIWTVAMIIVLLMPVASWTSARSTMAGLAVRVDVSTDPAWRPLVLGVIGPAAMPEGQRRVTEPPSSSGIVAAGIALWMLGTIAVLARLGRDLIHARGLVRRSRALDLIKIDSPLIRVAESDEISTPMTAGVFRPVILMPASAFDQPGLEVRAALEHERAHATRHDTLFYIFGRLVVACHWVNPLAWLALAHLRLDAERACDDRALTSGIAPLDYANILVGAASHRRSHPLPLGMAAVDDLEVRLTAVLQKDARREQCSRSLTASLATLGFFGVVLGGVGVYGAVPPVVAQHVLKSPTVLTETPKPSPSSALNRRTQRRELRHTETGDVTLIRLLEQGARQVPAHGEDLVAERCKWALSQARHGQLVAPLIELLLSPNERDAAYAAWTLGLADRSHAFEPLLNAMTHPAWRVRAEAAASLSRWADPRAAGAMRAAVTDEAWQVRLEVVSYFGALGDPASLDVVRLLRGDSHSGVRMEADARLATAERGGR